jgi:hypothetical protein
LGAAVGWVLLARPLLLYPICFVERHGLKLGALPSMTRPSAIVANSASNSK